MKTKKYYCAIEGDIKKAANAGSGDFHLSDNIQTELQFIEECNEGSVFTIYEITAKPLKKVKVTMALRELKL